MADKVLVMRVENGKMELSEKLDQFSTWRDDRTGNVVLRCHIPGCSMAVVATQPVGLHQLVRRAMEHLKGHP